MYQIIKNESLKLCKEVLMLGIHGVFYSLQRIYRPKEQQVYCKDSIIIEG